MLPAVSVIFGFFFGAAFGSFLNVVIYRLPRGMSLAQPPSHCPKCQHRLGGLDLFPLLSFLLAGAKCRYCKAPIGWRYFMVELLMGVFWAALWWQLLVEGSDVARFIALAAFATALVAALFIDLEHFIIPDSINAIILLIGLAYNGWLISQGGGMFTFAGITLPASIAGWIVGTFALWAIAFGGRVFLRRDAMGHGDIKLARGMGAVLFPVAALMSFGLSIVIGLVFGIISIIVSRKAAQPPSIDKTVSLDFEGVEVGEAVRQLFATADLQYAISAGVNGRITARFNEKSFEDAADVIAKQIGGEWNYVNGVWKLSLEEQPESIGALAKAGLGYLLLVDVIALFAPKLEEKWFGPAYIAEELEGEDDWVPAPTAIPFGPALAVAAILVVLFESTFTGWIQAYWDFAVRR
jgi:leader peptidase (prepilin peptidase)/N-methyltransferase